jgi:hypothetical protein
LTLRVTSTNSHVKRGASALCLVLFGLSLIAIAPFVLTSSLPNSNAASAAQLSISVAPSLLNASAGFKSLMSVQLLSTSDQFPLSASSPVQVILTSNNTNVAKPAATLLNITSGSYATENLVAGGAVGIANITASAPGYLPTWYLVYARAPITNKVGNQLEGTSLKDFIVPYFAPSEISSDNQVYQNLVVGQLQTLNTTSGIYYPEVAPSGGVQVWGRSSNNGTMSVSAAPYTIAQGSTYAMFNLTSSYFPGYANVTLQASDWNSMSVVFTSYGNGISTNQLNPYFVVQNTITPTKVMPGSSFTVQVLAQTVNAPISSAGANLTWSAQGANITSSTANLNSTGYGSATLLASKQSGMDNMTVFIKEGGITTYVDNITLNASLNNMNVSIINPHPSIVTQYTTTFMIHAVYNNTGVANASISLVAKNGTLINPPSMTNATGYALVTYESGSQPGSSTVKTTISKLGFTNATQDVNFTVVKAAPVVSKTSGPTNFLYTKIGNILPLWALIPIVAGAAGGGFFFFRRYRNSEVYYEDDE